MFSKKKITRDPKQCLNIWNRYDFAMAGLGHKIKSIRKVKYFIKCIRWSIQRIKRGYSDLDVWNMYGYLQKLIPAMLQHLKDTRMGSPAYLGENYVNEEGILVNDTCHKEWDKILDKMIYLWLESDEDTCSVKNRYEEEYLKAFDEFCKKYGMLGEKLQTEKELEENRKRGGGGTMHFMKEVPEYKEIEEKYFEEEERIDHYRQTCKDDAIDLLKEYFYSLRD